MNNNIYRSRNIDVIAIIPARMQSTRLPGKPLADINGKPLIYHVWNAACQSKKLRRIVVATDDQRIADACQNFGAEFIMTPTNIASGTDRIIFAVKALKDDADYILNIQGDEPLISGQLIDRVIDETVLSGAHVGTVISQITSADDLFNPSVVKVVLDSECNAMYFSRSPIPFLRDTEQEKWLNHAKYWKHIGIYAYSFPALERFAELPISALESVEKLEQMRLMQDNSIYRCIKTNEFLMGVDTPEDLERIREILK
jgi:3-deoxy-manno-octulosonate cytidylyltransferase (CMP-KDO synthetase)